MSFFKKIAIFILDKFRTYIKKALLSSNSFGKYKNFLSK